MVLQKIALLMVLNIPAFAQFPGDSCELPSGVIGTCTEISQCKSAIEELRLNVHPQLCGFEGNSPVVCCSASSSSYGAKSKRKCDEYLPPFNKNGLQGFAAVGGEQSLSKEFPHMAALGFRNGNTVAWLCGGSLISERYVITAAHCLNHREYGPVSVVRLGDLDLRSTTDDASPQELSIVQRIPHPQYRPPVVYNDIALLLLDKNVKFTDYVKPICLHVEKELPVYGVPVATGWGLTEYKGNASDVLIKVYLSLFALDECNSAFATNARRRLPNQIVDDIQICAGGRNVRRDTCQGDSGGPLQYFNGTTRRHHLIGITSFGLPCGTPNIPAVYTRLSSYADWIESIVWTEG